MLLNIFYSLLIYIYCINNLNSKDIENDLVVINEMLVLVYFIFFCM